MRTLPDTARELTTRLRADIPLAHAMDLTISAWDGNTLVISAPLAPNINDKGCAFGGSLVSAMTAAGWALVVLSLQARNEACDVFVARSEVTYRAPVWSDFEAHATLAENTGWDTFFATLARRGKARISMRCRVCEAGGDVHCATLDADYVAKRHTTSAPEAA